MGQDMAKGRRTEIENLNGFVVREGEQVGIPARANERLVDIVKRVERGDLSDGTVCSEGAGGVVFRFDERLDTMAMNAASRPERLSRFGSCHPRGRSYVSRRTPRCNRMHTGESGE